MTQLQLIKKHVGHFAAAHTLPFHDGGCANLHGHNYGVEITLIGEPRQEKEADHGMIVDFSVIKRLYKDHIHAQLDHAVIIAAQNPPEWYKEFKFLLSHMQGENDLYDSKSVDKYLGKVAHLPIADTTAECMVEWIFDELQLALFTQLNINPFNASIDVYEVALSETETSIAIYRNPRFGFTQKITREEYNNIQNFNPDGS